MNISMIVLIICFDFCHCRWFNSETVPHTKDSILEAAWVQPRKRSGDGLSSGDEEDPILAEEASENDSDRDKFVRRVFGFLQPHIRRHKKDTPASVSISLKLNSNWTLLKIFNFQYFCFQI
jgi:hypothetical protein